MKTTTKAAQKNFVCTAVKSGLVRVVPPKARARRPEWDRDRCVRCAVCYLYCPHGAVRRTDDGYFESSDERCRGCGVCHRECWFGVIGMIEEG